jgi:hypothetical protein
MRKPVVLDRVGMARFMGNLALAGGRTRSQLRHSSPTEPNELCAALHNRMPAILAPEAWPAWLGEQPADEAHVKALLAPYPFRRHDMLAGELTRRQCPE